MEISDITRGSRVTYAIGDAEYEAVALGTVTTGYNHAIRAGGFFLTLRYLDENGSPVTVAGAPLLGVDEGRLIGWHLRSADASKRPMPVALQPAPDHEVAQLPRVPPPAVLGLGPVIERPIGTAEVAGSGTKRKSGGDYSQVDDPYGIAAEYTSQSAAVDVRGNSPIAPRGLPTQAEADAIVAQAQAERQERMDENAATSAGAPASLAAPIAADADETDRSYETKAYRDGTIATGIAPLPELSPSEQDMAAVREQAVAEMEKAELGRPSVEDLDAVASEAAIVEATSAEPTADTTAGQIEAAE